MGVRDNIVGQKYGRLLVLRVVGKNKHGKYSVECICDCGNLHTALEACLKNGHTQSCGCLFKEVVGNSNRRDWAGLKVGRLTFIEDVGTNGESRQWRLLCDCGSEIIRSGISVFHGQIQSCGCLKRDRTKEANSRHGFCNTPTYGSYHSMLARCFNENSTKYPQYGGRGITVEQQSWLEAQPNGFLNFLEDMGERPDGHTLERKDVLKGYSKDNCTWATTSIQSFNQGRRKDNTSGKAGVYFSSGWWHAVIWKGKVKHKLGKFTTKEDAITARKAAEIDLYGFLKEG